MLRQFVSDRSGNFAMIAAIAIVPVVGAVALAVDYSDASNVRTRAQLIGDSAVLAGVKEARKLVADGVPTQQALEHGEQIANAFFDAQAEDFIPRVTGTFTPDITFNNYVFQGTGSFSGGVPTSFAKIFSIDQMSVDTISVANIGGQQYNEIHFLIDVSASMGVGASSSDVSRMAGAINCAFACHVPADATVWPDTIGDARAAGARLRIDVVRDAAADLVADLQAQGAGDLISVGVHTFSNSMRTLVPATTDLTQVQTVLSSIDIDGEWDTGGTDFNEAFSSLHRAIGASGTGNGPGDRRKTVIFVTDGVATNIQYSQSDATDEVIPDPNFTDYAPQYNNGFPGREWAMQGFDERVCDPLKRDDITMLTLNVEYVIPTVGTDDDIRFDTIRQYLKGDIRRKMEDCATERSFAQRADNPAEIERAMDTILEDLQAYTLRLTN